MMPAYRILLPSKVQSGFTNVRSLFSGTVIAESHKNKLRRFFVASKSVFTRGIKPLTLPSCFSRESAAKGGATRGVTYAEATTLNRPHYSDLMATKYCLSGE